MWHKVTVISEKHGHRELEMEVPPEVAGDNSKLMEFVAQKVKHLKPSSIKVRPISTPNE
jgi:hypothetical protein